MAKDLCEHCGTEADRTAKLDIAARCYGGFLCDPCLAGYQDVLHKDVSVAPREPIDRMFQEAAASGFAPLTEEQAEDFRQKLRGASAQIHGSKR